MTTALPTPGQFNGAASQLAFQTVLAQLLTHISEQDTALATVQASQGTGVIGKDTLANLNATLAYADGTIALVTNDSTTANNGYYRKSGATGVGSWVRSTYDPVPLIQAILDDQKKETYCTRYDSGGWYVNPATGVFTARRTGGGGADTRLFLLYYKGVTYTIVGTSPATRTLTIPYGNAFLWLDPAAVGFNADLVTLNDINVGTAIPTGKVPLGKIVYGDALNSQTLLDDRPYTAELNSQAIAAALQSDAIGEYFVTRRENGAWYINPNTGVVTVRRSGLSVDSSVYYLVYKGVTYTLKGTNGATRTLTLGGGNDYLYLDPAAGGFSAGNVTIADIQVGGSVPAGKIPLAHMVYSDSLNSRIFKDDREYAATVTASSNAMALAMTWNNDLTQTYHITSYDASGIYWDRMNSRLVVRRDRTDSDNRVAVMAKNPVNSTVYTFKGTNLAEKAITLIGGNTTLFIDPATVADPSNVTITDIKSQAGIDTPASAIVNGYIPIAWLVYGNAANSRLVKDYYSRQDTSPSAPVNVTWYSNKSIQYDPATTSFTVVGEDIPGDPRILIFDWQGLTYTISGTAGSSAIKALDRTSGHQYVCVNPASLTGRALTVNDFFFAAGPTGVVIAHLIYNAGLTSSIISLAGGNVPSVTVPRTGQAALFMGGKLAAEKQVYKVAIYGDSIFASGFKDLTFPDEFGLGQYEQPPRNCNFASVQRDIYNYLNFNKPVFRNALHANWTTTGHNYTAVSWVMPNDNTGGVGNATQWEQLRTLDDVTTGNTSEITITGNSTVVFVFESGAVGTDHATGTVNITVSVNGGAFVNPSTILQGKLSKRGFGTTKVYDAALNSFATSFTLPVSANDYNKAAPMKELFYNGLNPANTYRFRITKPSTEPLQVRLWGLYHFTGQTLLVHNESKPGFGWGMIASTVYGDLVVSETDFVIMEAPMYHDGGQSAGQIQANAQMMIDLIRGYGIQLAMCSCPPGGMILAGAATAILGDPSGSSYHPGQNFNNYFDFFTTMHTSDLSSSSQSPKYGDIYNVTVNGTTYAFTCINSDSPLPTGYTYWQRPANFPAFASFPVTMTKVTGTGKSTIIYTDAVFGTKFADHRDLMELVSQQNGVAFCDVFQAFANQAATVGETLYTDGYNMDTGHPLYATLLALSADTTHYPELAPPFKMNYMSNFVNIGDGHHLAYPAHPVIFEAVRNKLLKPSVFK